MEVPDGIIIAIIIPFLLIGIGLIIGVFWEYIKQGFNWGRKISLKLRRKNGKRGI
jgi:hypothetical protein